MLGAAVVRVLVTGANGQIGRRLIRRLDANPSGPIGVRAVVRSQRAADSLTDLPAATRDMAVLDYADAEALTRAAGGCDAVVHLVGIIKQSQTSSYEDAHERSTSAVAEAAAAAGMRRAVYLSILGTDPESSNDCLASKGRAERILLEGKTPAVVLRVPMVLGEGDTTARVVRGEALAKLLPLIGGGRTLAQPIYAGDVVEAIVAALTRDGVAGSTLDLAGPESLPQRELVARAARLHNRETHVLPVPRWLALAGVGLVERILKNPPVTSTMLEVIDHDDQVDPGPAARALGIELTSLDEMLRRCVGPEAVEA